MTHSINTRLKAAAFGASALVALTGAAQADQVFADDVIVQGSLCVGFDCVNGESFGFDTIRLKENNTRIKFQDTSTSGSFPTNDWQLTANDSANGGANKFSIDDIDNGRVPFTITAAARSNSIFVNSNGNVGFGTATPAVTLHARSGNTPTLRLEQDGSSGFAAQTWDVAGNETNFFVRDATNGSQLPLRIRPSAPSNSIFVQNNGDIGLGTASPDADLDIESSEAFVFMRLSATGASPNTSADLTFTDAGAEGELRYNIVDGDGEEMSLDADGNLTVAGNFISGTTTLAVPDYVFAEDYELMPLSAVEAFIAANSHLPEIPSAAQVHAGGLNISEMQLSLLKKVEELTLYTLQQQKTIDALQARLDTPIE